MLENNLDPEVAEKPEELIVYGGTGKAARSWEAFDTIVATLKRLRANETMLVQSGKAVGRLPDARRRAARPHLQLDARSRVGDGRRVPAPRGPRTDDVRPDDGGLLDLHRQPGHRAGDLRDVRRGRARLRGRSRRAARRHRGSRRDGRRAAARRDDERRRRARGRSRPGADRKAPQDPLPRRAGNGPRPRDRPRARREGGQARRVDRRRGQCRRPAGASARTRRRPGARHRPDLRARRAPRLRPARRLARRARAAALGRSEALHRARLRDDGRPRARAPRAEAPRLGRLRLRQQPPRPGAEGRGRRRLRDRRLRPALHPSALLRGQGAVPLGRTLRRPGGHPDDRPGAPRALSGRPRARPVAHARAGAHRVPGPAGADLLARLRRDGTARACASTSWCARGRCARRSSSAAIISTPGRWPRPTARRKACATAPTRSATGRS